MQRLTNISDYSRQSEPETTKYAVCIARDDADDKTCWVIEEYANRAAFDSHMAHPLVQDMIKWMSSGNILAGAPELYMLEYVDDLAFTKPEVAKVNDPYICFARIVYHPSKREEAVPYWKNVFAETKGESGTFVYGILLDKEKPDTLHTIEAYESKEFLWDVHVKQNNAIQESIKNTSSLRVSLEHNLLKQVGGYLSK